MATYSPSDYNYIEEKLKQAIRHLVLGRGSLSSRLNEVQIVIPFLTRSVGEENLPEETSNKLKYLRQELGQKLSREKAQQIAGYICALAFSVCAERARLEAKFYSETP